MGIIPMPLRLNRWTPAAILVIAGSTHSLAVGPFGAEFELSSLNGTNGFVCNGDGFSVSVSGAGDVNGDGIDDLVIGAYGANPNGTRSGQSHVVFGGVGVGAGGTIELSSLNGTNGFVLNGIDAEDYSGFSVSDAGDVNGDGIDDLIIGAKRAEPNGLSFAGESYVVFGGIGVGSGGTLELSSLNGTNGFVCNGIDANDSSGISVSSAGDVNGDGFDDIIIGAYHASPNGEYSGESYVVFGGVGVGSGGSLDLSTLNGTNGFILNGINPSDQSGWSVSIAGDVNGDGIDDLIIGAFSASANGFRIGESYVVFGGIGVGAGGTLELSSLNGTNGFVCNGIDISDRSGHSVSSAGDVNDDGIDDFIIGAHHADPNGSKSGESYVVFGGVGVGAGGTVELSSLNGANGFVCNGIDADDYSGFSVSDAGDINGDGFDDLIIGAYGADPNGSSSGESYIVFGNGSIGLLCAGTLNLGGLQASNGATGDYGFVCNGIANLRSGRSVSSAGDVNADGIDDLIIGSRGGKSYVVFGKASSAPLPGDINGDGIVDTADLGILIGQFGMMGPIR